MGGKHTGEQEISVSYEEIEKALKTFDLIVCDVIKNKKSKIILDGKEYILEKKLTVDNF